MAKFIVDTEELLTLPETAKFLNIGIATLFRWMKRGDINTYVIGHQTLIFKHEAERVKQLKEAKGESKTVET